MIGAAIKLIQTLRIGCVALLAARRTVKPDDHSEVVPLLPIPNRTVKRLSADDSADSRVKVGHCQAINEKASVSDGGLFRLRRQFSPARHHTQTLPGGKALLPDTVRR